MDQFFVLWLIWAGIAVLMSFLPPAGKSCAPERPPYPTNPAERDGGILRGDPAMRCDANHQGPPGNGWSRVDAGTRLPPAVETLDHGIRTWLDRDDIAAWIEVAAKAGYKVAEMPERKHPLAQGCGVKLAEGQWFAFCGETDMGQTAPALCTVCGGGLARYPGFPVRQDDKE